MKVTVIGAGNVGAKAVYYIAEKNIADIVMVDVVDGLAQSKAMDFLHAAPLRGYEIGIRGTTDFAEMAGSDVVVLTAGIARKPGMDRMDLLRTNVGIARAVGQRNSAAGSQRRGHRRDESPRCHRNGSPAGDGLRPFQGDRDGRASWIPPGFATSLPSAWESGRETCRPWCLAVTGTTWSPSRASPP